jgi:exopolyphosphatase/guanosine-5'-triphosphate,3'-diphosphate pyrophosphatase
LPYYATIDIGSNTILLLIGRITRQGTFKVVLDTGETTRLGRGLKAGGSLDPASIRASIECLKRFCSLCQANGVEEIAAVGTSALRMARDADQFIQQVQQTCGIAPRIIGEEEEALLSFVSVQRDPRMPGEAVVIDVGGGSTEYIFQSEKGSSQALQCFSLPLGALRLTEEFLHGDPPLRDEVTHLRRKIDKALLRLDRFEGERIHGLRLNIDDLKAHAKELQQRSLARRKQIRGLPPERADIIMAGVMIILSSMERFKKETIHLSCHGIRYGLFYERFMGTE